MKKILLLLAVFLAACSSQPQIKNFPNSTNLASQYVFKLVDTSNNDQASLLVLLVSPEQWRWLQSDPLGVPITRLVMSAKGWERDGFVPPSNVQTRYLFAAIAMYLVPDNQLVNYSERKDFADHQEYYLNGKKLWSIYPTKDGIKVEVDKRSWQVTLVSS
ncbi:hypothetical protein CKF54_06340 [Psittacicella hinzii]|uniref:Lipoprotein n=1 Tax=Psittacicella hinzii TaxID=2028575 RepID=A0A3A1Y077_9GAMM|nr:hypothetical protein [Psittacicella hinzii]RIY31653.1 hypothetical protein CKF54_06340 [Psittacicella hinzii]